jgi:DNA-directed RNA polymerase specialized sigma24 family protein
VERPLTEANLTSEQPGEEVLAIVELRYFAGLGIEEVAQVAAVSAGTVKPEWKKARAWLRRALGRGQGE